MHNITVLIVWWKITGPSFQTTHLLADITISGNLMSTRSASAQAFPLFDSTDHLFHFRLYNSSQVIDIRENSSTGFSGMLYQWTREAVPDGEPPTNRFFCLQQSLTPQQVEDILALYRSRDMDTLRHQEKIAEWDNGLDGITYIIETQYDRLYRFRTYWTPWSDSPIPEERLVYQFVDSCFLLAGSALLHVTFRESHPFYSYENGTGSIATRIVTWEQYQHMKRERKRYRKTVRRRTP